MPIWTCDYWTISHYFNWDNDVLVIKRKTAYTNFWSILLFAFTSILSICVRSLQVPTCLLAAVDIYAILKNPIFFLFYLFFSWKEEKKLPLNDILIQQQRQTRYTIKSLHLKNSRGKEIKKKKKFKYRKRKNSWDKSSEEYCLPCNNERKFSLTKRTLNNFFFFISIQIVIIVSLCNFIYHTLAFCNFDFSPAFYHTTKITFQIFFIFLFKVNVIFILSLEDMLLQFLVLPIQREIFHVEFFYINVFYFFQKKNEELIIPKEN